MMGEKHNRNQQINGECAAQRSMRPVRVAASEEEYSGTRRRRASGVMTRRPA